MVFTMTFKKTRFLFAITALFLTLTAAAQTDAAAFLGNSPKTDTFYNLVAKLYAENSAEQVLYVTVTLFVPVLTNCRVSIS